MIRKLALNEMVIFKVIDKNDQTLEAFVNADGFILMEVQPKDNNDYLEYQAIQLDYHDAVALSKELIRLIEDYDVQGTPKP